MDYYAVYKLFSMFLPYDVAWQTTLYLFVKCIDCNDMYVDEYYEHENKYRCKHHTAIKQELCLYVRVKCMLCDNNAHYGYNDIICYCYNHVSYKKTKILNSWFDNRVSIRRLNPSCTTGIKCSFCNKSYTYTQTCQCSIFCDNCLLLQVWKEDGKLVCNKCCKNNHQTESIIHTSHIICHEPDCYNFAHYGYCGILLFCNDHKDKYIYLFRECAIIGCQKMRVNDDHCYDHVSKKTRKQIDYILKN